MKKRTYTKRMMAIILNVIIILSLVPMTAFADGTYTYPSLSQSGNNTSTPGDKMSGNEPTVTIKKYSGQIFADTKAPAAEISIQENKWSS